MKSQIDHSPLYDERPWGNFTVIDEGIGYKVKRIEVLSGKRLSYQKHKHRSEHWYVVKGTADVIVDDVGIEVKVGEAVDIPVGSSHRVKNSHSELLVFIEVQLGEYLGEDDIVRMDDDFGRCND